MSSRDRQRGERSRSDSKSKWQEEAKNMFKQYAVPVIKAEGGKYISRQLGNLISGQAR